MRIDCAVDLALTLGPLQHGAGDPHVQVARHEAWLAFATPDGPATLQLRTSDGGVDARAWGDGSDRALAGAPALVGAYDDRRGWDPPHPLVRELDRRHPGLRLGRTGRVLDALVPTVLEQKVTGKEAYRAWRALTTQHGTPAPGPGAERGLRLPPTPDVLAALPSYAWHRCGVERRRASVIANAARVASRVEECADLPLADAYARLLALPGVGPWTAADIAAIALGDTDAVPVGDFHLPHTVGFALAGLDRSDDATMLELLAPYAGQRWRVIRLLEAGGRHAPRRGPRFAGRDIRAI